jgi:hypothetical protein
MNDELCKFPLQQLTAGEALSTPLASRYGTGGLFRKFYKEIQAIFQ